MTAVGSLPPLPPDWKQLLEPETSSPAYRQLETFLEREAADGQMLLPPQPDIFRAFELTPYHSVKVLLLGQDPYHTPGMAHGLCFSVQPHVRSLPPSLRNIFLELQSDLGCPLPNHGCLEGWASQGLLMLNAALSVRAHSPNSHRLPWQWFTDAVIRLVNAKASRVVFVLWGGEAKKKQALVTNPVHRVIACAHPSPLSAKKFFGSRSFSRINQSLEEVGESPIDWQISDCTAS